MADPQERTATLVATLLFTRGGLDSRFTLFQGTLSTPHQTEGSVLLLLKLPSGFLQASPDDKFRMLDEAAQSQHGFHELRSCQDCAQELSETIAGQSSSLKRIPIY